MSFNLKYCVKGSRKIGKYFFYETDQLVKIANRLEIDFDWPHNKNFEKEMEFLINMANKDRIEYSVHAPFFDGGLNSFNDNLREAAVNDVFHSIDMADKLKSKIVVLHPALEPYGLKIKERRKVEIDSYKTIGLYARNKEIMIGLENEAQTNFWFPDRACKFGEIEKTIAAVGLENFGLTLDIGHANVSGEDYIGAIERFGKKLLHIHAHDNLGKQGRDGWLDLHLAPGDGEIKWDHVLESLEKNRFQGFFTIECGYEDMIKGIKFLENQKV